MKFRHPLGLAAGFDKDGVCIHGLSGLGFSFLEVGTVTPQPQAGNPGTRLFRLLEDEAIINRLGFPSKGMAVVSHNLSRKSPPDAFPVGLSIGKNSATPIPTASQDYLKVFQALYGLVDYFVLNISSPNTQDLTELQQPKLLDILLGEVFALRRHLSADGVLKPILVKITPDLSWSELDALLEICLKHQVSGIVATNTSTERRGLSSKYRTESGGLSGLPLRQRTTEVIRHVYQRAEKRLTIVGVGGIFTGADIAEKMLAGASLVQAYTGFVYRGPWFVERCCGELRTTLDRLGIANIQEIIGSQELIPALRALAP